jgi:hypothetical protein
MTNVNENFRVSISSSTGSGLVIISLIHTGKCIKFIFLLKFLGFKNKSHPGNIGTVMLCFLRMNLTRSHVTLLSYRQLFVLLYVSVVTY